jgi:hypothetical protein
VGGRANISAHLNSAHRQTPFSLSKKNKTGREMDGKEKGADAETTTLMIPPATTLLEIEQNIF